MPFLGTRVSTHFKECTIASCNSQIITQVNAVNVVYKWFTQELTLHDLNSGIPTTNMFYEIYTKSSFNIFLINIWNGFIKNLS